MRRFILPLLLVWVSLAFTQNNTDVSFYTKMKSTTSELDSSQFKNKILYNRVFPWAGLYMFNQNGRTDTTSGNHLQQAVYELYLAGGVLIIC